MPAQSFFAILPAGGEGGHGHRDGAKTVPTSSTGAHVSAGASPARYFMHLSSGVLVRGSHARQPPDSLVLGTQRVLSLATGDRPEPPGRRVRGSASERACADIGQFLQRRAARICSPPRRSSRRCPCASSFPRGASRPLLHKGLRPAPLAEDET